MTRTDFAPPESAQISQRVVKEVAEETGTDPLELEPLFDVINPESLNTLFEPTKNGAFRTTGSVTFEYAGCDVTVHADASLEVTSRATRTTSQAEPTSVD